MELESSLFCSQEPSTDPSPGADQFSARNRILFP
jgi:hypothetical protein